MRITTLLTVAVELILVATPILIDIPKSIAIAMYIIAGSILILVVGIWFFRPNRNFPMFGKLKFSQGGSFLGMGTQNVSGAWGLRIGTFQLEGKNNSGNPNHSLVTRVFPVGNMLALPGA